MTWSLNISKKKGLMAISLRAILDLGAHNKSRFGCVHVKETGSGFQKSEPDPLPDLQLCLDLQWYIDLVFKDKRD